MKYNVDPKYIHDKGAQSVVDRMKGEHEALTNLIHAFAADMLHKAKMKALSGRMGWDDPDWPVHHITNAAKQHVDKGDPTDVALYMAFAWNRSDEPRAYEHADHDHLICVDINGTKLNSTKRFRSQQEVDDYIKQHLAEIQEDYMANVSVKIDVSF